jgi:Caspase domain
VINMAAAAAASSLWSQAQTQTKGVAAKPKALLVGNTRYRPTNRSILTAHKNVRNLEDVLFDMGYEPKSVFDASKLAILSALDEVLAQTPTDKPFFMYFCGHGINSFAKGEYRNYWLASGLQVTAPVSAATDPLAKRQHFERLAQDSPSLEDDIFPRFAGRADAHNFIMIDACREVASAVNDIDSTMVQTRPPNGCLIGYATSPGRFALTPDDPDRNSYFAESLIEQLKAVRARATDEGDMTQILQRVRIQVRERVNAIAKEENALEYLLGLTGQKTGYIQEPTFASSISNRAVLRPNAALLAAVRPTAPSPLTPSLPLPSTTTPAPTTPPTELLQATDGADALRWAQIEAMTDPETADAALQAFITQYPKSPFRDNAVARLEDVRKVRDAIRKTRIFRTPLRLPEGSPLQRDYNSALQGDKFAAQRIAEAIIRNPALGDAAAALRWLQFAGEMGNGIAAYVAFQRFNAQNLLQEATYHLALAQTNGFRPPRDFDAKK